jgi:hypothetical protein
LAEVCVNQANFYQAKFSVERDGNRLRRFGFLADWLRDDKETEYARYEMHTLQDGVYRIENKAESILREPAKFIYGAAPP